MIKDIMKANELVTPNQKEINVLKKIFHHVLVLMALLIW